MRLVNHGFPRILALATFLPFSLNAAPEDALKLIPSILGNAEGSVTMEFSFKATVEEVPGKVVEDQSCEDCRLHIDPSSGSNKLVFRNLKIPTRDEKTPVRVENRTYAIHNGMFLYHQDLKVKGEDTYMGSTMIEDASFADGQNYYPIMRSPLIGFPSHLATFSPVSQIALQGLKGNLEFKEENNERRFSWKNRTSEESIAFQVDDKNRLKAWFYTFGKDSQDYFYKISTEITYNAGTGNPETLVFEKRYPDRLGSRQEITIKKIEISKEPYDPSWKPKDEILSNSGQLWDKRADKKGYVENQVEVINKLLLK